MLRLYLVGKLTGIAIAPDATHPQMWRVRRGRAKDAARRMADRDRWLAGDHSRTPTFDWPERGRKPSHAAPSPKPNRP